MVWWYSNVYKQNRKYILTISKNKTWNHINRNLINTKTVILSTPSRYVYPSDEHVSKRDRSDEIAKTEGGHLKQQQQHTRIVSSNRSQPADSDSDNRARAWNRNVFRKMNCLSVCLSAWNQYCYNMYNTGIPPNNESIAYILLFWL